MIEEGFDGSASAMASRMNSFPLVSYMKSRSGFRLGMKYGFIPFILPSSFNNSLDIL